VRVKATASQYRWRFGDGGGLVTADPGGKYPAMSTSHVYLHRQNVKVSLSTGYSGEYSVAGGPWVPIDGLAWVGTTPVALQVVEAHARLVADNLPTGYEAAR
jgi:hypothetical protein